MARRAPQRLSIRLAKRRLKSIKLELAAIGGAYDHTRGGTAAAGAGAAGDAPRADSPLPHVARLIRHQLLRDMLSAIAEWSHAEGTERAYWRRNALADIATFRRRYLVPERQAFEAAVSQQHRRAA